MANPLTRAQSAVDFEQFLNEIRSEPGYRNQIVHIRTEEARPAQFAEPCARLSPACCRLISALGIERLYSHQAQALDAFRRGADVLVATGTASGKSLCYQLPLVEMFEQDPHARAILLFPTKALAQDQLQSLLKVFLSCGFPVSLAGVLDGDTPAPVRRALRDRAAAVLTNPDMLHASLLPQHARWADLLRGLRLVVVDELHTYAGLFGSNCANVFRRLHRLCDFYGSTPRFITCSASIGNPLEAATLLTGRQPVVIDSDGSPHGRRTFVFWNPPRVRNRPFRSRRSANVEACELMTRLVGAGIPTVTFSKAKVTAELIHRYARESLKRHSPHLVDKIACYRGGYLPSERRRIERRLWDEELIGVSTTPALEQGVDVGALDAAIIVGYPGTRMGFFQQAGRAGRRGRDSLAVLVGLDTAVNQYVMRNPEYVFEKPPESVVLDPNNPHVISGHLQCAACELPVTQAEVDDFGPDARTVLDVLTELGFLKKIGDRWFHATAGIPHHRVSLRDTGDRNVVITDIVTGRSIGELNKFDAQSLIHPEAIYLHSGDTYRVLNLDLDRMQCIVKRVETDYYTQPFGVTDVHHIDHPLRSRRLGRSEVFFGEVTVYFTTTGYEKIRFYELDPVSRHPLQMPIYPLETTALWITPEADLIREIINEGINVHRALMGIGYATRMLLPVFLHCETLDFSHSSCTAVNAPWHTVFIYERFPGGLGFTEAAYEKAWELLGAVLDHIVSCDCDNGCPCCVGKPLRGQSCWNYELGEATIPSRLATIRLLRGMLEGGIREEPERYPGTAVDPHGKEMLLKMNVRRRLWRLLNPDEFHPIDPNPQPGFPQEQRTVSAESFTRTEFRVLREMMRRRTDSKPNLDETASAPVRADAGSAEVTDAVLLGDPLASMAMKLTKRRS